MPCAKLVEDTYGIPLPDTLVGTVKKHEMSGLFTSWVQIAAVLFEIEILEM
ncbi:MAG: hypothetical protein JJU34_16130 [Lunatimonas sp.]|uniref:hypothetical protein n=1 Tax=Lunatimonas sp. TaxID=2060141 RepID=UPI00263AFC07|nr:hypothetical protein [Lunatimonas sp.]MCC5938808.1 hypothetical protein [Lunatimonas sp.]